MSFIGGKRKDRSHTLTLLLSFLPVAEATPGKAKISFLDFLDDFEAEIAQMAPCVRPGCPHRFTSLADLQR